MNDKSVIVKNLSKSYNGIKALNDISFEVKKGEIFGFIGPDGAGKTTLFRILTTLLLPDEGEVIVEGLEVVKNFKAIRKLFGYMPGKFSLYQDLTIEENLEFFATVFGTTIEENYHLVKDIYQQIEPFKKRKAGKLSGGMKQKLALSCALIHKPKVLFLDEPTTGVDPVSRKEFWDMLKKLQEKDITIVVSTPYMDEASLCDRVALTQKGHILAIDSPQHITNNHPENIIAISTNDTYRLLEDLRDYEDSLYVFPFGEFVHFTSKSNQRDEKYLSLMKKYLEDKRHKNIKIDYIHPDIEDCFMSLMNKSFTE